MMEGMASWRRSRGAREELARRRTFETALSGVRLHQLRLEPHCLQVGSRLQVGDDSCRRPTLESAGRATDRTARQPSADPASSEQNRQDNARIWIWIWIWHCRVLAVRSLTLLRRVPFCLELARFGSIQSQFHGGARFHRPSEHGRHLRRSLLGQRAREAFPGSREAETLGCRPYCTSSSRAARLK